MHAGTEPGATETYMVPDFGSTPHATFVPPPPTGIEYMGGGVTPEYIFDEGLGYPTANNYGYYCTGFEAPGEWGDHHRVFGFDGRDLHYSGLQTESLSYVYYPPTYGYAQAPINQYSPLIPGAVVGLDGPFIGSQQHFNSFSYRPPLSPAYIPVYALPNSDFVANNSADSLSFNTGALLGSRPAYTGRQYRAPQASVSAAGFSQRAASGSIGPASVNAVASSWTAASGTAAPSSQPSQSTCEDQTTAKTMEGSQIDAPTNNLSSCQEAMIHGDVTQGENSTGSRQATDCFPHVRVPVVQNSIKTSAPSNSGFTNFGSIPRSWAAVENYRPRLQFNGIANDGKGSSDALAEQNRGPRTNQSKGERTSSVADGADQYNASTSNAPGNIVINADQYNRDDFPVDYPDAKFFVIKSYSEDDVHRSIKYSVWSSTPNGNKRLDSAYEDAQKISAGKPKNCPVFLFFSVNASGQFCGVAEMVGPVDFQKDMIFWQQDKWPGSFPVKWHIIKDVPNASLRNIILENNENKPVTNSRDTQEIPYKSGLYMLRIFKSSPLKTSILDDFVFYEERQKKMLEEKCRLHGKSFDSSLSSLYVPAFVPKNTVDPLLKADEKRSTEEQSRERADHRQIHNEEQADGVVDEFPELNGKQSAGTVNLPSKSEGKQLSPVVDQPPTADGKCAMDQSPEPDGEWSANSPNQTPQSSETNMHHVKSDRKQPSGIPHQPLRADGKQRRTKVGQPPKSDVTIHGTNNGKSSNKASPSNEEARRSLAEQNDLVLDSEANMKKMIGVLRIGSLSIGPEDVAENSGSVEVEADGPDVVKVGSMHIKVKGASAPSSLI